MQHMMIDIETLGTGPTAPILSFAAATFDPLEFGGSYNQRPLYLNVSLDEQLSKSYAKPDADTVMWWLKQDEGARNRLTDPKPIDPESAYKALRGYTETHKPEAVWANGATFDFPILDYSHRAFGMKLPWHYRAVRDMRTLYALWGDLDNAMIAVGRTGEKHDALDDVIHQIKVVQAYYKGFKGLAHARGRVDIRDRLETLLEELDRAEAVEKRDY